MAQWSAISASTPSALHFSFTSAISASVSAEKRLIETTGTSPNFCMFSTWRCRLAMPALERLQVLLLEVVLLDAAVHLQRADGGDQHHAVGLEPGLAALDVEEFFRAEIGAEAGFRHHIVGELERGRGREHRIAAMRDIGEGAAMDEGGRAFQRLHQIRRQRILEQRRHRALRLEVAGAHRLAVAGIADNDFATAVP